MLGKRGFERVKKTFHNVQEDLTEYSVSNSHRKLFNEFVFVEIALEPETLIKINILGYLQISWFQRFKKIFFIEHFHWLFT